MNELLAGKSIRGRHRTTPLIAADGSTDEGEGQLEARLALMKLFVRRPNQLEPRCYDGLTVLDVNLLIRCAGPIQRLEIDARSQRKPSGKIYATLEPSLIYRVFESNRD